MTLSQELGGVFPHFEHNFSKKFADQAISFNTLCRGKNCGFSNLRAVLE